MKIDPVSHIGAVTRSVENRERDGRPARAVLASRTYDTTVEDLWDAITNPERLPRWFLPISGDLRLGGRYQFQGHAGGEITRCDRPRHLAVTWEFGGGVSWLDVRLSEDPKGVARLELEHVVPVDDHWKKFGPGAVGIGWDLILAGIALHVATAAAIDPKEAAAWTISAEGKEFSRRSSDRWCEADIASGTDPESAKKAARETTAAYTGEPVDSAAPSTAGG